MTELKNVLIGITTCLFVYSFRQYTVKKTIRIKHLIIIILLNVFMKPVLDYKMRLLMM